MAMPAYTVGMLAGALGDLTGRTVVVLGASYRGGVKETAFSGVFPTVAALTEAGARALVHDPLFTDEELAAHGLQAYHLGENADAAIVQADHRSYTELGPADLPGIQVLVDGRHLTDPARWAGVRHLSIGVGRSSAR